MSALCLSRHILTVYGLAYRFTISYPKTFGADTFRILEFFAFEDFFIVDFFGVKKKKKIKHDRGQDDFEIPQINNLKKKKRLNIM